MARASEKFNDLGAPRRVWVIAAPRGEAKMLAAIHDALATRFVIQDRIVYTGNYLGRDSNIIDELLAFRSALLSKPGVEPWDFVCLRGPAEEAWQKLLRIQFAAAPPELIETLLLNGVEPWLRLYGSNAKEARSMARLGNVELTRWTLRLRQAQRAAPGHESFISSLRRAAYIKDTNSSDGDFIVVPAGFDVAKSLEEQGELLWEAKSFPSEFTNKNTIKYRVVRGMGDSLFEDTILPILQKMLIEHTPIGMTTIDAGCGNGGYLICAGFTANGRIIELLHVDADCNVNVQMHGTPPSALQGVFMQQNDDLFAPAVQMAASA